MAFIEIADDIYALLFVHNEAHLMLWIFPRLSSRTMVPNAFKESTNVAQSVTWKFTFQFHADYEY